HFVFSPRWDKRLGVKRVQDRFLHVHTICGLLQDNGVGSIEHFVSDFRAAVRRKTVHEDRIQSGLLHEFAIHLIGLEDLAADLFFSFETHAGPGIGVDRLSSGDGFVWIGKELNFGASFLRDTLGICNDVCVGRVVGGSGNADVNAKAGGKIEKRVANVVAIADIGEFESFDGAELLLEGEEIRQRLARMKLVRKRVDNRNSDVGGHFFKDALFVDARHDALNPLLEISSDVGNGLAFAEARLGVVEKDHEAAHALNTDLKGDASA